MQVRLAHRELNLEKPDVERLMRDVEPEVPRDHFVVVNSLRFPPKQVLACVAEVDRADFTTHQARSVLRRLGFPTGRCRSTSASSTRTSAVTAGNRGADHLAPFLGRWVAVAADTVLVAADDPRSVVQWLVRNNTRAESMFRVPVSSNDQARPA